MDCIVISKQKFNKMRKFDMIPQDAVLAFKLLDSASLEVKDKQIAIYHVFNTHMKSAPFYKRIFIEKKCL